MTLRKTFDVEVRTDSGHVSLVFTLLYGGSPEKDSDGAPIRYGLPLNQSDGELAEQVKRFAVWVAEQAAREVQQQRAEIGSLLQPGGTAPTPPSKGRK